MLLYNNIRTGKLEQTGAALLCTPLPSVKAGYNGPYRRFQVGTQTICTRCVMDNTVPSIRFDEAGVCQYCKMHDQLEKLYPSDPSIRKGKLDRLVRQIKSLGRRNRYDCVSGVSGGRDSTYALYLAVKSGLRPLAVHFDNCWDSDIAVSNIHNATSILGVDLETVVADWDEFKDLQISFLKASVPDVEIPTDVAIHAVLHKVAAKNDIKYIFFGHSFRTEGIAPLDWSCIDGKYIEMVQRTYGKRRLNDFNNFKLWHLAYYSLIKRIRSVPFLNYFEYDKKKVSELLTRELKWVDYGGHHHESTYTKFIQSYLLPQKFNIDKRKIEYSAYIRSGQMSRERALREIQSGAYPYDPKLLPYVISKLGLSREEWNTIYSVRPKSYKDYPSYQPLLKKFRQPIKWAARLGLVPELLYLKYLG